MSSRPWTGRLPVATCAVCTVGVAQDAHSTTNGSARIRAYRTADDAAVRRIWRETVVLGAPTPFDVGEVATYERLCLDWHLDPANHEAGRADAVVVEQNGGVHGYLLACLDQAHFDRWSRRRAVRWALGAVAAMPRLSTAARRFVRLRVRDGLHAARHQPPPPFPAHMHVNLDPGLRDQAIGHQLVGWMDRRVERAGLAGYVGEVNVPEGRSLRAIEAAGARVVARVPNRTFSWLLGTRVDRCVIARDLALRTDAVPRQEDTCASRS